MEINPYSVDLFAGLEERQSKRSVLLPKGELTLDEDDEQAVTEEESKDEQQRTSECKRRRFGDRIRMKFSKSFRAKREQ